MRRSNLFSIFKEYSGLVAAISEKEDGSMLLKKEAENKEEVINNRKRFLEKLGVDINWVVSAKQVHGNNVEIVKTEDRGKIIPATDGLVTRNKGVFLSITVADCLPVFILAKEKGVVGLIHCGWRGLAKNILKSSIQKITDNFQVTPKDILVGIGPGISKCHFEVGESVLNKFQPFLKECAEEREGKKFLDLKKIAQIQLLNLGVLPQNIEINPECTYCLKDKYFSFRRDKPKNIKTMLAVIGIK